ncbi:MAG: glycosyltransferase family 1 protein [Candidatus Spechtbacterales bacterium]|nr:glycosyltransferase family 1 protein [Candidatus Spechtbacterales bacterium]
MLHIGIDGHNLEAERTGVGRYLENLLKEFTKMPELRNQVRFTIYFKGDAPSDDFLKDSMFNVRSLKKSTRGSFALYFSVILPFNAWRDKVDILWFPGYMVPYSWIWPSAVVLHDIIFERYPSSVPPLHRFMYRIFGKYGAQHSEKVFTVSEYSKQEINALYGVNEDKIIVTPLGIDKKFKVLENKEIQEKIKNKYDIEKKYMLYLGQIFNRRHVPETMKAFARIANEFPDYQLLVVGKNRTQPFIDIDKMAKDLNDVAGRNIILRTEYVPEEDMVPLYNGARIGFYISDYEGFGLPPLEMLACGTPVLAPATTSLKTTLQGEQVIIEDPEDVQEIAYKLKRTLLDERYLEKMKERGPEYAAQFTWDKTAKKTIEAFLDTSREK